MQKISIYLATNRISVTTDTAGFITENRKVYQRKLKLYKGIDNTIEFEVKNSDQRKVPVVGYDVVVKFYDANHKNLFTVQGSAIPSKMGLMSITVLREHLEFVDPQQLYMAAYLLDSTGKEQILYSDSQFGVLGAVEIYDGYNDKFAIGDITDTITKFNYEMGLKSYVSELAVFGTNINDDYSTDPYNQASVDSVQVDIHNNLHSIYEGDVLVQASVNKSTAIGNSWDTISTIKILPYNGTNLVTSQLIYKTLDGTINGIQKDYKFLRFMYYKPDSGSNARFDVIRNNGTYSVSIINGGINYNIGDRIKILGTELDGTSIANDLYIRVTAIDTLQTKKSITAVDVSGTAVLGSGLYRNKQGVILTGTIDKILIRN